MKLAFCFLTYDSLIRYDIWNQFFHDATLQGATGTSLPFSVFIHSKNKINGEELLFPHHILPISFPTKKKSDISIVRATLFLLKEAHRMDPDATYFIFLSQHCVPLYSFKKLYHLITRFPHSVISSIPRNKQERHQSLTPLFRQQILPSYFTKQQSNMILIRDDVSLLLQYDFTHHFEKMECPDEHYFINIMVSIFKRPLIPRQIVFCNTDISKTQSIEFRGKITSPMISQMRQAGFLFMRKVMPEADVSGTILENGASPMETEKK